MQPLAIRGAWVHTPPVFADARGEFAEVFRQSDLRAVRGAELAVAQVNLSVSSRGVVRGVHFADTPPGQAKWVMCVQGAIRDVVVDVRPQSPTFGQWDAVALDEGAHAAVFLEAGLGHGFSVQSERATVVYLCSSGYDPAVERAVNPFDPALAIDWQVDAPVVSDKDRAAPTLAELRAAGVLPS